MKRRPLVAAVAGFLLIPGLAAHAAAQEPARTDLHGVVVMRGSSAPVVSAIIELPDRRQVVSDANGRFVVRNLMTGALTLRVMQLGYQEWIERVTVAPDAAPLRIELVPDPILLSGIRVVSDRLKVRRNSLATSVRAYDADQLAASPGFDAFDFVRGRIMMVSCPARSLSRYCVVRRGQTISPAIYVDESRWFGGLDVLVGWNTRDLYLIEVISSGAMIRVYTKGFAERLALGRTPLFPVIW